MYATQTHDGRKLYYVEVEGARDVDYGWLKSMSKNTDNALKNIQKYVDKHNIKFPFEKLKVTGAVADSYELVKQIAKHHKEQKQ